MNTICDLRFAICDLRFTIRHSSFVIRHSSFPWLWLGLFLSAIGTVTPRAQSITNAQPVNVSATSFAVLWRVTSSAQPKITVYADPAGTVNLAGQLEFEYFPLDTGNPLLEPGYERRQNWAALQDKTRRFGLMFVRVSGCAPATPYYYRLHAIPPTGPEVVWPNTGPLPSVRTARETSFAATAKQLLLTIAGGDVAGYIGMLRSDTAAYPLAVVIGDGAGTNQIYFNLNELLSLDGSSNSLSPGEHTFAIQLMGPEVQQTIQQVQLNIPAGLVVDEAAEQGLAGLLDFLRLSLGSTNVLAGEAGSVPIELIVRGRGLTNINFTVGLEEGRLTALGIASLVPELGAATIQPAGSNRFQFGLQTGPGQTLIGVRPVARLNFKAASQTHSAIVPLHLLTLEAENADGVVVTNLAGNGGRVIVISTEPVLDVQLNPNRQCDLVLYGRPWTGYAIEFATQLAPGPTWTRLMRVPLTGTFQVLEGIAANPTAAFYRAYELPGSPPALDMRLSTDGAPYLILYGTAGRNYQLLTAPVLSGQNPWSLAGQTVLTHSFQMIDLATNTAPRLFYRVREQ